MTSSLSITLIALGIIAALAFFTAAGFRGSGLAWMVDILSGVLTGGNHAGRVKDPFDDFSGPQNIGHLFITFKANLFQKNYSQRIKDNIKTIKKLPKIKGLRK